MFFKKEVLIMQNFRILNLKIEEEIGIKNFNEIYEKNEIKINLMVKYASSLGFSLQESYDLIKEFFKNKN